MATVGYRYSLEWFSPYADPPDGKPRILAEMYESVERRKEREARGEPSVPLEFVEQKQPHYSVYVQAVEKPSISLPPETLASIRKKKLAKRLRDKYPMFADQFYEEETNRRELYYSGQDTERIRQGRENVRMYYEELYIKFLEYIEKHEKNRKENENG
jgi:hypothetical protein